MEIDTISVQVSVGGTGNHLLSVAATCGLTETVRIPMTPAGNDSTAAHVVGTVTDAHLAGRTGRRTQ